jgi:hypothetical protein
MLLRHESHSSVGNLVAGLSIASGAALMLFPRRVGELFALPSNRPWLVRSLGLRDVLIGAGLLKTRRRRLASAARALADLLDFSLIVGGARARGEGLRAVRGPALTALSSAAIAGFLSLTRADD